MSAPTVATTHAMPDTPTAAASTSTVEDVAHWDSVQTYVTELNTYCTQLRWSANELEEEAREIRRALALLGRKQQVQRVLFDNTMNSNDDDEGGDEVEMM
ncbi:hypothetical protein AaE_010754 [Aphanomyces astaci]|uniref:Uncharacterized protein n=1 Tax=Aphanomyces astaci TaxID=112090 RepID=A0A6A4ZXA5_APHAT|nr:hypothetical protein AaE_010754 [Aphanomyces astaci]